MKNFYIVIAMVFSFNLFANVKPLELSKEKIAVKIIKEKVSVLVADPEKVCRYYAIVVANQTGAAYGSAAWQQAFLDARADCMAEIQ